MTPLENFNTEQYKTLREEVILHVSETRKIEVTTVAAVGAIYAWALTHSSIDEAIWMVPPVLVLLAGLRSLALLVRIQELGRYLEKLECFFTDLDDCSSILRGWENSRPRHLKTLFGPFANTASAFWLLFLLVTASVVKWHPIPSDSSAINSSIDVNIKSPLTVIPLNNLAPAVVPPVSPAPLPPKTSGAP